MISECNKDLLDKFEDIISSLDARSLSWQEYDEISTKLRILNSQLDDSVMMNAPRDNM